MKLVIKNTLDEGVTRFKSVAKNVTKEALEKAGLQYLNWIVNGSPTNTRVPPILMGILRGSGSVFVGSKLISASPNEKGNGTPNLSHSAKDNVTTIGYNTSYAARMHEENWKPGPVSVQSGDCGNKYIESHLKSDGKLWLAFVAKLMEKKL